MNHVVDLLYSVPTAAALVNANKRIVECNDKFIEMALNGKNKNVLEWLAEGPHKTMLAGLFNSNKAGWHGAEISLNLKGKLTLCWCENHTLIITHQLEKSDVIDKKMVHFFEFQDVEKIRALEAAYLHQLRRVIDDNLWILDEEGILLWVRADNAEYENSKGHYSDVLIMTEDRQLWHQVLSQSRKNPGKTFEVQLRADIDGQARYIDLCYLSSIMGGRFYVASRSTAPSGSRIILRLKEAWGIISDDDLAKKLLTRKKAILQANEAESVPPNWLIKTSQMTGFSLDWLFTGQGHKRRI